MGPLSDSGGPYEHVVLVSLDTLRSDGVGANQRKLWPTRSPTLLAPKTGVLDDLAGEGVFFTNCVASAPYTSASHASFLTGCWPLQHGVYELFNRKLRKATLFRQCRQRGYRTVMKVDFPLMLGHHLGFTADIDDYLVEDDDGAIEAIARTARSVSLVHFGGIHAPYGFHNLRFGGDDYRAKVAQLEEMAGLGQIGPGDERLEGRYTAALQALYQDGEYEALFTLYLQGIEYFLERRFTPFLERLRARLSGTRYLIVLFGDHGEEFDEENFGHQASVAEGVLRVPLVLVGEGIEGGRQRHERVRAVDLAPTVLEAIAARAPAQLDGQSLQAAVWGDAPPPCGPSYAQAWVPRTDEYLAFVARAVRTGRKVGRLDHVCYREAVYDGAEKLTRENHRLAHDGGRWSFAPGVDLRLERIIDGAAPELVDDALRGSALLDMLDSYGRRAGPRATGRAGRPGTDGAVDVPPDVREKLRALGYRV